MNNTTLIIALLIQAANLMLFMMFMNVARKSDIRQLETRLMRIEAKIERIEQHCIEH